MAILDTTQTFDDGDQVTSTKLNNIIDQATFKSGTNEATDNATLVVDSGGYLKVGVIESGNIATNAVTTAKIADSNVTTAKIADSNVTTAKIADSNVTTAKIADSNVTPAKLSQPLTLGTAQASTSGTSIDFTGIPSWAKRITVLFDKVSTNGPNSYLVQIGSGSISTSGYSSTGYAFIPAYLYVDSISGFVVRSVSISASVSGIMTINLVSGNTYIQSHTFKYLTQGILVGSGVVTLGGSLDRLRITTVNGTDIFDAGSINIMYE